MAEELSARDIVRRDLVAAGLDEAFVNQLIGIVDGIYTDNIVPTEADVLTTIRNSEPYKKRFAGNEIIRKRMASGQGMPGDRILSAAEYIELEGTYRDLMSQAGLPAGFYDTPDDFANMIGSGISAAEVQSRINTASDALNFADKNTVDMLQSYYGLSTGDLVAYLLDPTKASEVLTSRANTGLNLSRMYNTAKVGGTALTQGTSASKGLAEEIVTAGKAADAENAFAAVADSQSAYQRLVNLQGETGGAEDLARTALQLEGGTTAKKKIKKVGQKERSAFATKSALSETSLFRAADV